MHSQGEGKGSQRRSGLWEQKSVAAGEALKPALVLGLCSALDLDREGAVISELLHSPCCLLFRIFLCANHFPRALIFSRASWRKVPLTS